MKGGNMQKNPVCYWELASDETEKSINFLKEVFDLDVEYDKNTKIYEVPADDALNGFAGGGVTFAMIEYSSSK